MSNVRFSVNIPVYNKEQYLCRCIDSVLNQTFTDFEIILSDDGSTDGSADICTQYAKENDRVRTFLNANQGPLFNRLFLCGKAQGEYLLFLDSDDTLAPNALETLDEVISRLGCDLVIYNFTKITSGGSHDNKPIWEKETVFETEEQKRQLYEKQLFTSALNSMSSRAFKAELCRSDDTDYSGYAFLRTGEDFLQSLHITFAAEKIVAIPDCIYNYYDNSTGLTRSSNLYRYKSVFAARQAGLRYVDSTDYRRYADLVLWYAMDCVKKIAFSDVSFSEKRAAFDELKRDEFYNSFVLKYFKEDDLSLKKRMIYRFFSSGRYRELIFALKSFGKE